MELGQLMEQEQHQGIIILAKVVLGGSGDDGNCGQQLFVDVALGQIQTTTRQDKPRKTETTATPIAVVP